MPHYKDGTKAKIGDIVKGRGYNIKHEIIGAVVGVKEYAESCNLTVQCVAKTAGAGLEMRHVKFLGEDGKAVDARICVPSIAEYGQADAFEKIA